MLHIGAEFTLSLNSSHSTWEGSPRPAGYQKAKMRPKLGDSTAHPALTKSVKEK